MTLIKKKIKKKKKEKKMPKIQGSYLQRRLTAADFLLFLSSNTRCSIYNISLARTKVPPNARLGKISLQLEQHLS